MTAFTADGLGTPVSVASEHGLLHGQLVLLPGTAGLVVLAHAGLALDSRDHRLAEIFRRAGLSTLCVDLLSLQEERFNDMHNNIALLAKRLLDFLGLLKHRTLLGELESQPLGIYASNATSPVAVRVAALRDHDIAAVVCRGGLIDLAGMLYLHALESPLLLLAEASDEQHILSSRRALLKMHCPRELKLTPESGIDLATSNGFQIAADEAAQWFVRHFRQVSLQSEGG